jgi:hypothetical protein
MGSDPLGQTPSGLTRRSLTPFFTAVHSWGKSRRSRYVSCTCMSTAVLSLDQRVGGSGHCCAYGTGRHRDRLHRRGESAPRPPSGFRYRIAAEPVSRVDPATCPALLVNSAAAAPYHRGPGPQRRCSRHPDRSPPGACSPSRSRNASASDCSRVGKHQSRRENRMVRLLSKAALEGTYRAIASATERLRDASAQMAGKGRVDRECSSKRSTRPRENGARRAAPVPRSPRRMGERIELRRES